MTHDDLKARTKKVLDGMARRHGITRWQTLRKAQPVQALAASSHATTSGSESTVRDTPIHAGCNNWYIDVANPPKSYRVDIGYLSPRGRFYVLARSNVVSTPRAGVSAVIDENWSDLDPRK